MRKAGPSHLAAPALALLGNVVLFAGCGDSTPAPKPKPDVPTPAEPVIPYATAAFDPDAEQRLPLEVWPQRTVVDQHVGGEGEVALEFRFTVPVAIEGRGLPVDVVFGPEVDDSVVQIEVPVIPFAPTADETFPSAASFDYPLFCWADDAECADRGADGYWRADLARDGVRVRELQLAPTATDSVRVGQPNPKNIGLWLDADDALQPGDVVLFSYTGGLPTRATDWSDRPFLLHLRYRADRTCVEDCWVELDDAEVRGLQIHALPEPTFIHAIAPLDVAVGEAFGLSVVITDRFGNPRPVSGTVTLTGGVNTSLLLQDTFRAEIEATYPTAGAYRVVPALEGKLLRPVYHWTMASDAPPVRRLMGDTHVHTGDGGAQRKFLDTFTAGDHAGLYTRTNDALWYLEMVAGYDFGSISEHAVREDAYELPPDVATDADFQPGGPCEETSPPVAGVDNWWPMSQAIAREYDGGHTGRFTTFPAFEWHGKFALGLDAPLHRIVLYRDFDAADALPILPGYSPNTVSQCLVRFLSLAGYGPDRALILPHMMTASIGNIDWDLTYVDTGPEQLIATYEEVESYQRVGEIFSARNQQESLLPGLPALRLFEGDPIAPAPYTFRYGWRNRSAHIGVIGSSDNHSQMPGVDDVVAIDGTQYHEHEPGGAAVVLAQTRDRDGIFDALSQRATYATSGPRVWLDYALDGAPMGAQIARAEENLSARLAVMAGMKIVWAEISGVRVGDSAASYETVFLSFPDTEVFEVQTSIDNPVQPGGDDEEWLYYARIILVAPGGLGGHSDAVWSSPIWVEWSAPTG